MNSDASRDIDGDLAREILRIRLSQLIVNEKYRQGLFSIPIHLALGHEAIAVALDGAMNDGDDLLLSHRNIHYNLARAKAFRPILDEYLLKSGGLAHAQLGSMNLANPTKHIVYTSSILGNNLSCAAGLALAHRVRVDRGVVFVVTGDGAIEEGAFYESLLFLKSYSLPSAIIVENNEWSMHTSIPERRCRIDLESLAASIGASYNMLSGNDVYDYIRKLRDIRQSLVDRRSPWIIEVPLATLGGWHVESDGDPQGRFIHPHAGPIPSLDVDISAQLEASDDDPVFVLQKYLSRDTLDAMEQEIKQSLSEEVSSV